MFTALSALERFKHCGLQMTACRTAGPFHAPQSFTGDWHSVTYCIQHQCFHSVLFTQCLTHDCTKRLINEAHCFHLVLMAVRARSLSDQTSCYINGSLTAAQRSTHLELKGLTFAATPEYRHVRKGSGTFFKSACFMQAGITSNFSRVASKRVFSGLLLRLRCGITFTDNLYFNKTSDRDLMLSIANRFKS